MSRDIPSACRVCLTNSRLRGTRQWDIAIWPTAKYVATTMTSHSPIALAVSSLGPSYFFPTSLARKSRKNMTMIATTTINATTTSVRTAQLIVCVTSPIAPSANTKELIIQITQKATNAATQPLLTAIPPDHLVDGRFKRTTNVFLYQKNNHLSIINAM
ncbi:MAG: hypothetical protein BWY43_00556 [candidate division WS2 bacterium ADurb.Bin280]|uniref:Uncharacterized protein n=1 Tax=candidate division WS2 bacterium ADurb.Bin280 TaxID=1852829 RepID=A0A1V5SE66_9BACT|nr:MAG: hypothetical protein BWY43_00556 [candidate division WS2 bacterium ADurb.Bin280]